MSDKQKQKDWELQQHIKELLKSASTDIAKIKSAPDLAKELLKHVQKEQSKEEEASKVSILNDKDTTKIDENH